MIIFFKSTSLDDTVICIEATSIYYLSDAMKIAIHTADGMTYTSCAEIDYYEYLELIKSIKNNNSYNFIDLSDNSFDKQY